MYGGCLENVWRVPGGFLEGVWMVSKGCLHGTWKLSGWCQEGVWKISGRLLEGILNVSVRWLERVRTVSGGYLESIKIILLVRIILGCSADTVSITCLSLKILIFATKLATTCRSWPVIPSNDQSWLGMRSYDPFWPLMTI